MAAAKEAECVCEFSECSAHGGRQRVSKTVRIKRELRHATVRFRTVNFMGTWLASSVERATLATRIVSLNPL